MKRRLLLLAFALAVAGCATSYQSQGLTGGYAEREISPDVWRIGFAGNGYTTRETVQTFWLYRACEFTLSKGFDGFEVLEPSRLSSRGEGYVLAQAALPDFGKPVFAANIRLLKKPFTKRPPRVFDAAELKATLEPRVKTLCDGNVCPHVHLYLMPDL